MRIKFARSEGGGRADRRVIHAGRAVTNGPVIGRLLVTGGLVLIGSGREFRPAGAWRIRGRLGSSRRSSSFWRLLVDRELMESRFVKNTRPQQQGNSPPFDVSASSRNLIQNTYRNFAPWKFFFCLFFSSRYIRVCEAYLILKEDWLSRQKSPPVQSTVPGFFFFFHTLVRSKETDCLN